MRKTIALCCLTALAVAGLSPAFGAVRHLLTGKDIKNHSLTSKDIKKGSIQLSSLDKATRKKINRIGGSTTQGAPGENGTQGPPGSNGTNGTNGTNGADSNQPRVITSADPQGFAFAPYGDNSTVDGRGPDSGNDGTIDFTTPPTAPALGTKAMEMVSTNGKSVVTYAPLPQGSERPALSEVSDVNYESLVKTRDASDTGGNTDVDFKMEVTGADVGTSSGYTTIVYEPYQNGQANKTTWTRHNVAKGKVWSSRPLVGANAGACTQGAPCSFSEFQSRNPNAVVQTAKFVIGQNNGAGWVGFDGFADDLTLGFGPAVRYDLGG